ncbi:MAG: alpha/beta fold hydrolase [Gammaproteobacteria bacterium]|nr:alpha/beta fold hydrolase [Rhodocyclaceae bacterium]MBU3908720.1 alpha/beta fold hydrolase [Gammaproteobacteria bacterium]MBU3988842.1 alpha/beta fold hydrolase [Gammaproteobacteria bacterium]MBU4004748.1 alpha/beta fold hydrolase [Gammaproteobacteria bacterium]MBU4021351.1 alpha/beta fold hydrolase [Gammaproteobacteria bacterium]
MKDLVLLPGWGFDSHVWQPLTRLLEQDFRIQSAIDDLPAGAVVCGWSLGALTAMQMALAQPERIGRLILIGATPRFIQAPDWPHAQPPALLEEFAKAVAADPHIALRRFVALLNQGDAQARRLTRELSALLATDSTEATLAAGLKTLRDTDLRADVGRIRQPVLLLHGAHDALMPLAAAEWLTNHLPAARLEVFPDTAHAPFLAQPERCAELLRRFAHE